jgi:hypothetical protein
MTRNRRSGQLLICKVKMQRRILVKQAYPGPESERTYQCGGNEQIGICYASAAIMMRLANLRDAWSYIEEWAT